MAKYRQASQHVHAIFQHVADHIEPLALDEAYLDVTLDKRQFGSATATATWLRQEIQQQVGITASAGIGPNKLIAKIACGYHKPNGQTIITPNQAASFLFRLPLRSLPGIGPKTAARAADHNWHIVGDLRTAQLSHLKQVFGSSAETMRLKSWGIDHSPVQNAP